MTLGDISLESGNYDTAREEYAEAAKLANEVNKDQLRRGQAQQMVAVAVLMLRDASPDDQRKQHVRNCLENIDSYSELAAGRECFERVPGDLQYLR